MTKDFWRAGLGVLDGFVAEQDAAALLTQVEDYRQRHNLPLVERRSRGRDLRYQVIDRARVPEALPGLDRLLARIDQAVADLAGRPLTRLDGRAGVNVNITAAGGSYRWHYDRCPVTAMLYLSAVPGGELELYPNLRLPLGRLSAAAAQRAADRLVAASPVRRLAGTRRAVVRPAPGTLVAIRGDRVLHSVAEVREGLRVNLVLGYTTFDGQQPRPELDAYLYSNASVGRRDPNYR